VVEARAQRLLHVGVFGLSLAKGSSHSIQYERADLVNREVADLILQIRDNRPRTDYGSTITE